MAGAIDLFLADDSATQRLGQALATMLRRGDILLLEGGLGAGKSALARAIIRTLLKDPEAEIPSPSFSLVQPYDAAGLTVLHADLYRLSDEAELEELGLFDAAEGICIVEWPERAPGLVRDAAVRIALALGPEGEGRLAEIGFALPARQSAAAVILAKAVQPPSE